MAKRTAGAGRRVFSLVLLLALRPSATRAVWHAAATYMNRPDRDHSTVPQVTDLFA